MSKYQFVEFNIHSLERFTALQQVFAELKRDKDSDDWRSTDELLKLFDNISLRHFYWPTDDERARRLEELRSCVIVETPTEKATDLTWDFDSLIDAFMNGEYELVSCELTKDGVARLNCYALSYPYGGIGCMVALVEAFDCIVTGIDDGTGFIDLSNRRP